MSKAIVMIGGGIQEVPAVKQVQDMGYQVIVTDRNPRAPAFRGADESIVVDGLDDEEIKKKLWGTGRDNIVGIFTLTELFVTVSKVAEWRMFKTIASVASSETCHHKIRAKQRWLNLGIPTARGQEVKTEEEALELFHFFDNDAFLKPDVGFGAHGCKRVQTEDELLTQFWYVKQGSGVLLEEYLSGTVHDVNAVFDKNGKFYSLSITDRKFEGTREVEASAPSILKGGWVDELYELTEKAARALGTDRGPVKADVMRSDLEKGPGCFYFMEMATRLHGPMGTLHLIPESLGIRPIEAMVYAITGQEIPEHCTKQKWQFPKVARRNHDATITVKEKE